VPGDEAARRLEQALAFSEQIIASSGAGIVVFDRELRRVVFNPAAERLTGLRGDEVLGTPYLDGLVTAAKGAIHEALLRALDGETVTIPEAPFTNPATGASGWASVTCSPHRSATGETIGVIVSLSDVTERKRAEQRMELALDSAGLGLWEWNLYTGAVVCDGRVAKALGRDQGDLPTTADSLGDLIAPEEREGAVSALWRAIETGDGRFTATWPVSVGDRDRRWVEVRGMVTERDGAGRPTRCAGTVLDVNERKRIDDARLFLARCGYTRSGEDFFRSLAEYLAQSLAMDFVCIDRLLADGRTARTLAVWRDGEFQDNMEYALADTPCGDVVGRSFWCFAADVCTLFPRSAVLHDLGAAGYAGTTLWSFDGKPIGLIALIRRQPLADPGLAEAVLGLVGPRAAGEMERQQAEAALRQSEETHRALVAGLPDVVMRFDRDGRHLFVSDNVTEVVDLRADELIGKTHREAGFDEEPCLLWEGAIRGVFDSGLPFETEFQFDGGRGTRIHNWRLLPERGAQGAVRSVLSLSRDITAHRRAEEDYRTLFHEMLEGFALHEILCDEDGRPYDYRFLAANPAFERMTGLGAADLVGRTVLEALPGIEPGWIETYGRVALTGEPAFFEEYAAELGMHFQVTAFRPAPRQFACIVTDVTERKRAEAERANLEAQLQQAQRLDSLGVLAGGIAHDFNNILAGVRGFTEMALEEVGPGCAAAPFLQHSLSGTARATELVQQILAFSRTGSMELKPILLGALVRDVLRFARATLPATVEIRQDLAPGTPAIQGDPTQIHQVVLNLCTNAEYAMRPRGGVLTVALRSTDLGSDEADRLGHLAPGRYVALTVADTGCGIDPAILGRLFEPFFTTKPTGEGTGMGLATSHGIVTRHGGAISVESQLGVGTVFGVYLPALGVPRMEAPVPVAANLPMGTGRILLVDDEPTVLEVGASRLRSLGYAPTAVSSSQRALDLFLSDPAAFDLILTDQTMPNLTGLDLAAEVRATGASIPIVLATGFSQMITPGVLQELGICEVLAKPFTRRSIAEAVCRALDGRKPK
jgi:two-component system, cell cycle sensor histidine kinase and response regulator CckA